MIRRISLVLVREQELCKFQKSVTSFIFNSFDLWIWSFLNFVVCLYLQIKNEGKHNNINRVKEWLSTWNFWPLISSLEWIIHNLCCKIFVKITSFGCTEWSHCVCLSLKYIVVYLPFWSPKFHLFLDLVPKSKNHLSKLMWIWNWRNTRITSTYKLIY